MPQLSMGSVELARPARKEVVRLTPEQEARIGIARLTQQLLDLHIREPRSGAGFLVMYGSQPDKRTDAQKRTKPFAPSLETYAVDRTGEVALHLAETPISVHLIVSGILHPKPEDSVKAEYRRPGVNQEYIMVGGPTFLDGSPAPAEATLALVKEGQILADHIKRGE